VKKLVRLASLALFVVGLTATVDSKPAFAFFHHHHKHATKSHQIHHKHKKHAKSSALVRDAQTSLVNLGYYAGHPDGKMGPKTTKAIKAFQRDHSLPKDGKLTKQTYNAIIKADSARAMASLPIPLSLPHDNALAAQPGLVGPTDQQYADPLLGGTTIIGGNAQAVRTQELTSRFAKLDINENINGGLRRYNLTLNGNPVLQVDNQPSIIGISQTYSLGHEDAIILTTYHDGDPVCAYKHYLLALTEGRNELHAFGNCTHGYQARVVEDSLFVTFPEVDDARVAASTWRYESGDLEKL
jgi:hypothetical protein